MSDVSIGETRSGTYRDSQCSFCNSSIILTLFYNKEFIFKKENQGNLLTDYRVGYSEA